MRPRLARTLAVLALLVGLAWAPAAVRTDGRASASLPISPATAARPLAASLTTSTASANDGRRSAAVAKSAERPSTSSRRPLAASTSQRAVAPLLRRMTLGAPAVVPLVRSNWSGLASTSRTPATRTNALKTRSGGQRATTTTPPTSSPPSSKPKSTATSSPAPSTPVTDATSTEHSGLELHRRSRIRWLLHDWWRRAIWREIPVQPRNVASPGLSWGSEHFTPVDARPGGSQVVGLGPEVHGEPVERVGDRSHVRIVKEA